MRKKWTLQLAAFVATGTVVLLWWPPPSAELQRLQAELRASGEKLTFQELAPAYASNIAFYHEQFTGVVSRLHGVTVEGNMVSLMATTSATRMTVAWRQPYPAGHQERGETWSNLLARVDASAAELHQLHDLSRSWPRGLQSEPADPYPSHRVSFITWRKATQFLSDATMAEAHRGRLDAALTNLCTLIRFAALTGATGSLREVMISAAMSDTAVAGSWELFQAPGWDEPRLAALQRAWQDNDLIPAYARCAEFERAFGVSWFDEARTVPKLTHDLMLSMGAISSRPLGRFFKEWLLPVWRNRWSYHDEFLYLKNIQVAVSANRAVTTHRSYQTLTKALQDPRARTHQGGFDEFRYPLHDVLLPSFTTSARKVLYTETQRQLVLTALALRRWHLQQAGLPEDLTCLVPAYLPALPRDCMNGGVLRYRRENEAEFTLYSVGLDGQDDGGNDDDVPWPKAE